MSESDSFKASSNQEDEINATPTKLIFSESPKEEENVTTNTKKTEVTKTNITNESYFPLGNEASTSQPVDEHDLKIDTKTTEEAKEDFSELITFKEMDPRKRPRCQEEEEDENKHFLLGVFLRSTYPLNCTMEKTITVGIFKTLNFRPAVLLNQCGKTTLLLTAEMWDRFTKYEPIIEAYLCNSLTGRKTTMGFDNSDIEIDSIRVRGTQFVRFRDLSKHNKKILLTFEEFHVLSNVTPAIIRYIQQLNAYHHIIFDYLNCSINKHPVLPLIYGPLDNSIYNRLPQEVAFYRKSELYFRRMQNDKTSAENDQKEDTNTNVPSEDTVKTESSSP